MTETQAEVMRELAKGGCLIRRTLFGSGVTLERAGGGYATVRVTTLGILRNRRLVAKTTRDVVYEKYTITDAGRAALAEHEAKMEAKR